MYNGEGCFHVNKREAISQIFRCRENEEVPSASLKINRKKAFSFTMSNIKIFTILLFI